MDSPLLRSPGPSRLLGVILGLSTTIGFPIVAAAETLSADRDAPTLLVRPATIGTSGEVRLEARVEDQSGVARVVAWTRGEKDGDFRAVPMAVDASTGTWTATLRPTAERGSRLSYFIEATDVLGNGPRRAGSLGNPYTLKIESSPLAPADGGMLPATSLSLPLTGTGAAAGILALILFTVRALRARRNAARAELAFWHRLLDPLADARGSAVQQAVQDLCARRQAHPKRGQVFLERREVLRWLDRFREEIVRAEEARIDSLIDADWGDPTEANFTKPLKDAERTMDERFWFSLLEPLTQLSPHQKSAALERLAAFPQSHPLLGLRYFEADVYTSRLAWIHRMTEEDLLRRRLDARTAGPCLRSPVNSSPTTAPLVGRAAGVTLIEMLIVLALLAIGMVVVGARLTAFERPLLTASQEFDAVLREARARAMSTTSALRIRPVDESSLAVERALNCGSGTWTEEPRLAVDLPRDVTFTATDWEICYSSRGLTAENTHVTLTHPRLGSREVEVLLGGSARWTP